MVRICIPRRIVCYSPGRFLETRLNHEQCKRQTSYSNSLLPSHSCFVRVPLTLRELLTSSSRSITSHILIDYLRVSHKCKLTAVRTNRERDCPDSVLPTSIFFLSMSLPLGLKSGCGVGRWSVIMLEHILNSRRCWTMKIWVASSWRIEIHSTRLRQHARTVIPSTTSRIPKDFAAPKWRQSERSVRGREAE